MAYTTINKPTDYFNTTLYTGDGTSSNAITGVGFQPDFSWFKTRSDANGHTLIDSVRGITKRLASHNTQAEITQSDMLESFDSDGFTLGDDSNNYTNWSGKTWVAWNWKANGAGSANTDGSISSTVSASATSGFSIVSYTGTGSAGTIGHGLGSTPKMIIFKDRSNVNGWHTYHSSFANATDLLLLDTTNALYTANNYINNTRPTSSVFSLGNTAGTNGSSANYIAYCFAEKTGYSKFGSYTGTNSDDGTFLYLGFKPAFIMVKAASGSNTPGSQNWVILDNKRSSSGGNNVIQYKLFPSANDAENTAENNHADFLSNGVKFRGGNDATNGNNTYIYMAFAEQPLVGSNNVPCTAR